MELTIERQREQETLCHAFLQNVSAPGRPCRDRSGHSPAAMAIREAEARK